MFMFKYFLVTLVILYVAYYAVMLFIDVKKIKKSQTGEERGQEVDISKAVESYQAKSASAIIRESLNGNMPEDDQGTIDEMDMDYSNEAPAMSDEEFMASQGDSNLPFDVEEGDTGDTSDTEEHHNGGLGHAQTLEKDKSLNNEDMENREYAPVEHSAGVNVIGLSQLFEQANLEESLFKEARLSA